LIFDGESLDAYLLFRDNDESCFPLCLHYGENCVLPFVHHGTYGVDEHYVLLPLDLHGDS